jgi:uncharacterized membrane protein YvbJ
MAFCRTCGSTVSEEATFCMNCGTRTDPNTAMAEAGRTTPASAPNKDLIQANPLSLPTSASTSPVRVLLAVIVVVAAIAIFIAVIQRGSTAGTTVSAEKYTKAMFDSITTGMTKQQVQDILGGPGTLMSQSNVGGYSAAMYDWQNSDGSNMTVEFGDGVVVMKAQFGLQ